MVTVSVPLLKIPPPKTVTPLAIVRYLRCRVAPEATCITCPPPPEPRQIHQPRPEGELPPVFSHDEIARVYQVNQSTVTRWLSKARVSILEETRRIVCARLQVAESEFDSLAELVESQLDLSLSRLLEDRAELQ